MTDNPDSDDTEAMLDKIEEKEDSLSDWERKFVDETQGVLGEGLPITHWRLEKLIEIYNKVKDE